MFYKYITKIDFFIEIFIKILFAKKTSLEDSSLKYL